VKQVPPAAPAAEGSAAPNQKPPEKIEPEAPDYEEIEQRFMQVRTFCYTKGSQFLCLYANIRHLPYCGLPLSVILLGLHGGGR
jgi:hypothetical protein